MRDILVGAIRDLSRHYLRTAANIAGYFCGSAFIVAIVLMLQFELQSKSEVVNYMGTHFMAFSPLPYSGDTFAGMSKMPLDQKNEAFFAEPMVITRLLPISFAEQIRQIPEVLAATPFLLFRFKQGQDGHVFSVGGLNPADTAALKGTATTRRDIVSGAFFGPDDRRVVLVDESYAQMWNLKPGSVVNIADSLYPVIGIVRPGVRPVRADIYMNWPDAQEAINKRLTAPLENEANIFLVESAGLQNHATAVRKVEKLMQDGIITTFNCSIPAIEVMGISTSALKLVVVLVFVLVLLFAANSQLAAVSERRRDIAILKAIGWNNRAIFCQIITESCFQAIIGSIVGFAAGWSACLLFAGRLQHAGGEIVQFAGLLWLFAVVVTSFCFLGAIAALFPAARAADTRPAALLREA